jgi:hypothetical protein
MEEKEEEKDTSVDLIEDVYKYLDKGGYRQDATALQKHSVRRKADKFEIKDVELYYKKADKSKVNYMTNCYNLTHINRVLFC